MNAIRQELAQLPITPKTLRHFGWLVGGILAALGGWFLFRHKPVGPWLLTPGLALLLLGTIAPATLRRPYLAWMTLGLALGLVVSTTLLTLFFFLVITPIGWIARLAGQDFLSLKLAPKASSYWLKRPAGNPPQAADYERQF